MKSVWDPKNLNFQFLADFFFTCGKLSHKHIVHNSKRLSENFMRVLLDFLKKEPKTKKNLQKCQKIYIKSKSPSIKLSFNLLNLCIMFFVVISHVLNLIHITERFFLTPVLRNEYFERFFLCRSTNIFNYKFTSNIYLLLYIFKLC